MNIAKHYTKACPACNHTVHEYTDVFGVYKCTGCGAIHGECFKRDAGNFYKPYWSKAPNSPNTFYIDLVTHGLTVERFHGWINSDDKCIVQVG